MTRSETRTLLRLAGPIILSNLGFMGMATVDILLLGNLSPAALAVAGIAHSMAFFLLSFGIGMVQGLDPVLSQAVGAGDRRQFRLGMQRGLLMALVVGGGIGLLLLPGALWHRLLGQPPELEGQVVLYLRSLARACPSGCSSTSSPARSRPTTKQGPSSWPSSSATSSTWASTSG